MQNPWIYHEVMKIVLIDRIAMFNRYFSKLNDPESKYNLPKLPDTYRILENLTVPFRYIEMKATRFHGI